MGIRQVVYSAEELSLKITEMTAEENIFEFVLYLHVVPRRKYDCISYNYYTIAPEFCKENPRIFPQLFIGRIRQKTIDRKRFSWYNTKDAEALPPRKPGGHDTETGIPFDFSD